MSEKTMRINNQRSKSQAKGASRTVCDLRGPAARISLHNLSWSLDNLSATALRLHNLSDPPVLVLTAPQPFRDHAAGTSFAVDGAARTFNTRLVRTSIGGVGVALVTVD